MDKVQPGSVVRLKSGGPNMTVRWVEDGEAYCEWFTEVKGNPDNKGAAFPVTSLELLTQ
jgi:uncharacterized protein YodC (DUF2158 family)